MKSILPLLATVVLCLAGCDGGASSELEADSGTAATMLCSDTCGPTGDPGAWTSDGECDDGGEGSLNSYCALGTDCSDCGARETSPRLQPPTRARRSTQAPRRSTRGRCAEI